MYRERIGRFKYKKIAVAMYIDIYNGTGGSAHTGVGDCVRGGVGDWRVYVGEILCGWHGRYVLVRDYSASVHKKISRDV